MQLIQDDFNQVALPATSFSECTSVAGIQNNSLSNGATFTTQQSRGSDFVKRGFRYRVRIATLPDILIVWGELAGIQTARSVGTTQ